MCGVTLKATVFAHKVNSREELLHRILSAARTTNNAAVLRKVTSSLVTRVRKCIQADGGHLEQFAWSVERPVCNCTFSNIAQQMHNAPLSFLIYLLYCTLKTTEPLPIEPMCIWRFWLRISSGIKSRRSDLNFWDTVCVCVYVCVFCVCQLLFIGPPSFSSSTLCAIISVCFPTYILSYVQIYPHFSVTWSRDRSLLARSLALHIITYRSLSLHLRLNINCTVLQSDLWDDTM